MGWMSDFMAGSAESGCAAGRVVPSRAKTIGGF